MQVLLRFIKKLLLIILLLVLIAVAALYIFDYSYILKGVRVVYFTGHTTAFIDDFPYFDTHTIATGTAQPLPKHENYNSVKATSQLSKYNQNLGNSSFYNYKK